MLPLQQVSVVSEHWSNINTFIQSGLQPVAPEPHAALQDLCVGATLMFNICEFTQWNDR